MNDRLSQPLRLPCGAMLRNRLAQSRHDRGRSPTRGCVRRRARAAVPHVERRRCGPAAHGQRAGRPVRPRAPRQRRDRPRRSRARTTPKPATGLRRWARAGTAAGNHLWVQIAHAGRQSPRYVTGRARSRPRPCSWTCSATMRRPRALTESGDPRPDRTFRTRGTRGPRNAASRACRCTARTGTWSVRSCRPSRTAHGCLGRVAGEPRALPARMRARGAARGRRRTFPWPSSSIPTTSARAASRTRIACRSCSG